jgi:hypothetical protein
MFVFEMTEKFSKIKTVQIYDPIDDYRDEYVSDDNFENSNHTADREILKQLISFSKALIMIQFHPNLLLLPDFTEEDFWLEAFAMNDKSPQIVHQTEFVFVAFSRYFSNPFSNPFYFAWIVWKILNCTNYSNC